MIPYIDQRLREWAEWSHLRIDGFIGIGAGQFDYEERTPSAPLGFARFGEAQLRSIETEEGVAWLRSENWSLGDAVIITYRDHPNWSTELIARALRVSRMTLWRRLDTAHALLLGYFLDRAVGLLPQTEGLRLAKRIRIAQSD